MYDHISQRIRTALAPTFPYWIHFFAPNVGIEDKWLWNSYTRGRQKVSDENWGIENEIRAFLVSDELTSSNLHSFQSSGKRFSTKASLIHARFNRRSTESKSQLLLCRVVVGRVLDNAGTPPHGKSSFSSTTSHSEVTGKDVFACRGTCLAYPGTMCLYWTSSAFPFVSEWCV